MVTQNHGYEVCPWGSMDRCDHVKDAETFEHVCSRQYVACARYYNMITDQTVQPILSGFQQEHVGIPMRKKFIREEEHGAKKLKQIFEGELISSN